MLSADVMTIPESQIRDTKVTLTVVGGRIVYGTPVYQKP